MYIIRFFARDSICVGSMIADIDIWESVFELIISRTVSGLDYRIGKELVNKIIMMTTEHEILKTYESDNMGFFRIVG